MATTMPTKTISFARGVPAPDCIPAVELADCARSVLEKDGKTILSYGSGAGYTPLREYIAKWFGVHPHRVVLTNGSLQGLALLAGHSARFRSAMIESPTYDRAIKILLSSGASLVATDMDEEGLLPQSIEDALRGGQDMAFLYTIPTFQNPTGRTLSAERRQKIVEIARGANLMIVEDDPYSLIRFEGEAPPAMFDLSDKTSIYSSSFSKTIAPGLRVGWFILPDELATEITEAASSTYITPVLLGQAIALEFIRRGSFEPNLERVNDLLRLRRDAMLDALEKHLAGCTWSRPEGGYFIWLEFPRDVVAAQVLEKAEGVTFVAGPEFGGWPNAARLAFSFVSPEEIELGVERIAAALDRLDEGEPAPDAASVAATESAAD
jgi:DNA-binding transcriptional MocR family regulator